MGEVRFAFHQEGEGLTRPLRNLLRLFVRRCLIRPEMDTADNRFDFGPEYDATETLA